MQVARKLVTEDEFLRLPESTQPVELVDGEVIVSPSPSFWHQEILGRLAHLLRNWAAGRPEPITIGQAPLDVRFGPGRVLQPDAFVLACRLPREHSGPIEEVPLLCVEVVSDRVYDRVTKRLIYAAAGVREYWVVEPAGLIERWSGEGLGLAEEWRTRAETPLLPGLSIDLPALFALE